MAVKSTGTTESKTATAPAQPAAAAASDARPKVESDCVVESDYHVGRAIPGTKVCSYHTMHYAADGSRRT